MTGKWYDLTAAQLEKHFATHIGMGLSVRAASDRLRKFGQNDVFPVPRGSFRLYLKHILTDFTTILLAVTAIISAVFEQNAGAVTILCLLAVNLGAALFTYVKAQRVLESMGSYAIPNAKVVRDGQLLMVRQGALVPGDVIYIAAGDIVPCDARLVESDGLFVLETRVTGEASSLKKDANFLDFRDIPIKERLNMVYAATVVTAGAGKAIVCDTGDNTLVADLGKNESLISHEQLKILTILKKYCRTISLCMLGLILALTVLDIAVGAENRTLFEIFLSGLTLAVAAMSEFYAAFGYIIVGCGIFNAVRRYKDVNSGAVIRNAACLDELRDLSCLIVPKEALFAVRMSHIDRVYANGRYYDYDMRGFERNSSTVMTYAVLSTGLYGANKLVYANLNGENVYTPEEDAIIKAAENINVYNISLEKRYVLVDHRAVGNGNRFETSLVKYEGGFAVTARGDAQQLLGCCTYYSEDGRVSRMTTDRLNDLRITASQITKKAYRVIAVASKNTDYNNLTRINACQSDMTFEGFLCIREPILPGAVKNIDACQNAGIKVIMTTSDIGDNNRYIAAALGIIKSDEQIMTSAALKTMREGLIRAGLPIYRLYEGLNTDQKLSLISMLREDGEKVGVLARGLEDMALLRDADIGIAQSLTISPKAAKKGVSVGELSAQTDRNVPVYARNPGASSKISCEAVKFITDVIVSEPDKNGSGGFNAIFGSMSCARVIYKNLLRAARYLLASQSARLFIMLYSVIFGTIIFTPAQLLFSGLILDFAAVIVIAFEKPSRDIFMLAADTEEKLKHPLRHNFESALFGLFWAVLTIVSPLILNSLGFAADSTQLASMSFIGFILTQLAVLSETKKDRSIFKSITFNLVYALYIALIALFIGVSLLIPPVGSLFGIVMPTTAALITSLALPTVMLTIFELYKLLTYSPPKRKKADNLGAIFNSGFRVTDIDEDEMYSTAEININSTADNKAVDKNTADKS